MRRSLLGLLALAACEHAQSPVAPPQFSSAAQSVNGQIVFSSSRDGNGEIYVMNGDGSNVTRLTDNPASDGQPTWSPDGSRIAFVSNRDGKAEIYVMNADGTGVTRLTTTPTQYSRAPDWCGQRIAFESDRYLSPFPDIYVMNEDGSGVTRLTISNADFDQAPTWSPDCSKIAFTKDPSGKQKVYVMNADGSGTTALTSGPGRDREPAWSPDGSQIAFQSSRDEPGSNWEFYEIYRMNSDGTGVTRLTFNDSTVRSIVNDLAPAWSPDGSQIAFVSAREGGNQIFVMNLDGSDVTRLTTAPGNNTEPEWFAHADTVPPDTVPPDTVPPDTVPPDTVPPDTMPPDTMPPDTIPADTIPPDTIPADTVPPDTMPSQEFVLSGRDYNLIATPLRDIAARAYTSTASAAPSTHGRTRLGAAAATPSTARPATTVYVFTCPSLGCLPRMTLVSS